MQLQWLVITIDDYPQTPDEFQAFSLHFAHEFSNMDDQVRLHCDSLLLSCIHLPSTDLACELFEILSNHFDFQELGQLEAICKQLYESTDPGVRSQAEKTLINFTESPNCLQKCQIVLERSTVSELESFEMAMINKITMTLVVVVFNCLNKPLFRFDSVCSVLLSLYIGRIFLWWSIHIDWIFIPKSIKLLILFVINFIALF